MTLLFPIELRESMRKKLDHVFFFFIENFTVFGTVGVAIVIGLRLLVI